MEKISKKNMIIIILKMKAQKKRKETENVNLIVQLKSIIG